MAQYEYIKTINSDKLKIEIGNLEVEPNLISIDTVGSSITLTFDDELNETEEGLVDAAVDAHVAVTTAESLKIYLDSSVMPFINNMINTFAAENISLGITQAGKTADTLAVFVKQFPIGANSAMISFKDCCDTGSLYAAREVLIYVRANPSEYSGLSPYITDARLLVLLNKIETFLGIYPLST